MYDFDFELDRRFPFFIQKGLQILFKSVEIGFKVPKNKV